MVRFEDGLTVPKELLATITDAFLQGSADKFERDQFHVAMEKYKSLSTSMARNLKEAKYEYYVLGLEREYKLEARVVDCMQRLGQDIGGLRSAASTQFLLLAEGPSAGNGTPVNGSSTPLYRHLSFSILSEVEAPPMEHRGGLTSINEIPEDDSALDNRPITPSPLRASAEDSGYLPTANSPGDIFSRFIDHLGPSMVSHQVIHLYPNLSLTMS